MLTVLTFVLDGHRFGLRAGDVSGAVRAATPTPLPGAPRGVLGVLNVRGVFRPVVELRSRFGLPSCSLRPSDRLLLARSGAHEVALVVDHSDTLLEVDEASIAPAPADGDGGGLDVAGVH